MIPRFDSSGATSLIMARFVNAAYGRLLKGMQEDGWKIVVYTRIIWLVSCSFLLLNVVLPSFYKS